VTARRLRPFSLDNPKDADRILVARLALLEHLQQDVRILDVVRRLGSEPRTARLLVPGIWSKHRQGVGAVVVAPLRLNLPADHWLMTWAADMALLVLFSQNGTTLRVSMVATGAAGFESRGARRAKKNGDTVRRDVGWFYRARLKSPRETTSSLGREYIGDSRRTDARTYVLGRIAEAARLLDL
jgi:hypothetical protein